MLLLIPRALAVSRIDDLWAVMYWADVRARDSSWARVGLGVPFLLDIFMYPPKERILLVLSVMT